MAAGGQARSEQTDRQQGKRRACTAMGQQTSHYVLHARGSRVCNDGQSVKMYNGDEAMDVGVQICMWQSPSTHAAASVR
jgi:hypothetical protein